MTAASLTDAVPPADTAAPPGRRWAKLGDAAAYCTLSRRGLLRMEKAGLITIYRPTGNRSLVDLDELDAGIAKMGRRPA